MRRLSAEWKKLEVVDVFAKGQFDVMAEKVEVKRVEEWHGGKCVRGGVIERERVRGRSRSLCRMSGMKEYEVVSASCLYGNFKFKM